MSLNVLSLQIGGYDIPKGTTVFGYIYAIARDPEYWKDPDEVKDDDSAVMTHDGA